MLNFFSNINYDWLFYSCAILSYILGSLPFGIILTKIFKAGDLRSIGSGNIGATNVLRTGRKDLALLTLILDAAKGGVAVYIASFWGADMAGVAAIASVAGHIFPIWLRFRGGKGVATTLGVILVLNGFIGLITCVLWLAIAIIFRYSSLASLISMGASPFLAWQFDNSSIAAPLMIIAILIWFRHIGNIIRLIKGTENKIGKKHENKSPEK